MFLLASITAFISSNTINNFDFIVGLYSSKILDTSSSVSEEPMNAFEFSKSLIRTFSLPLISN